MAVSQNPGLILLASGMAYLKDSEAANLQKFPTTNTIPVLSVTTQDEEDLSGDYASTVRLYNQPVPIKALVEMIRPYVNAARSLVN